MFSFGAPYSSQLAKSIVYWNNLILTNGTVGIIMMCLAPWYNNFWFVQRHCTQNRTYTKQHFEAVYWIELKCPGLACWLGGRPDADHLNWWQLIAILLLKYGAPQGLKWFIKYAKNVTCQLVEYDLQGMLHCVPSDVPQMMSTLAVGVRWND